MGEEFLGQHIGPDFALGGQALYRFYGPAILLCSGVVYFNEPPKSAADLSKGEVFLEVPRRVEVYRKGNWWPHPVAFRLYIEGRFQQTITIGVDGKSFATRDPEDGLLESAKLFGLSTQTVNVARRPAILQMHNDLLNLLEKALEEMNDNPKNWF